jgi:stage II sporulation protein AA (anti-sigma F factor antagonist)
MNATATSIFEVTRTGDTLVVTPQGDLRELDWYELDAAGTAVLRRLDDAKVRNVVVDFAELGSCGSTALGLFAGLWRKARRNGGGMAICNVSDNLREVLAVTRLDDFWPAYESLDEALRAVRD